DRADRHLCRDLRRHQHRLHVDAAPLHEQGDLDRGGIRGRLRRPIDGGSATRALARRNRLSCRRPGARKWAGRRCLWAQTMTYPKHPIPTTVVGSYPQPEWLIDRSALEHHGVPRVHAHEIWRIPEPHLRIAQDDATILAIREMEQAGIDIISDGEI